MGRQGCRSGVDGDVSRLKALTVYIKAGRLAGMDTRQKSRNWTVTNGGSVSYDGAQLAVLMDIRDELQGIRSLMNCYRVPRALDALYELGVDARRRKRLAAAKRKAARK